MKLKKTLRKDRREIQDGKECTIVQVALKICWAAIPTIAS